ncbi:heterocycloanthracin/sonorensin family bacteriocin, partial [Peribacillus tepidiphilus]|uniref:heterocycloanthracin/sonorensin family bacteriocin n=1 Tax=Peribacillus tepidiphilus TaxID=2652445 RepID=UPI0035B4FE46
MKMNDFYNDLQTLNIGDFQANEAIPWDQNQYYYMDTDRQWGGGFRCFSCFSCFFCFNCFSCSNCFRCSNCAGRCGGRCG